jgi:hypothetical protein
LAAARLAGAFFAGVGTLSSVVMGMVTSWSSSSGSARPSAPSSP